MSSRPADQLPGGQTDPCSRPVWLGFHVMESFAWRRVQHPAVQQISIRINTPDKHSNIAAVSLQSAFCLRFEMQRS